MVKCVRCGKWRSSSNLPIINYPLFERKFQPNFDVPFRKQLREHKPQCTHSWRIQSAHLPSHHIPIEKHTDYKHESQFHYEDRFSTTESVIDETCPQSIIDGKVELTDYKYETGVSEDYEASAQHGENLNTFSGPKRSKRHKHRNRSNSTRSVRKVSQKNSGSFIQEQDYWERKEQNSAQKATRFTHLYGTSNVKHLEAYSTRVDYQFNNYHKRFSPVSWPAIPLAPTLQ